MLCNISHDAPVGIAQSFLFCIFTCIKREYIHHATFHAHIIQKLWLCNEFINFFNFNKFKSTFTFDIFRLCSFLFRLMTVTLFETKINLRWKLVHIEAVRRNICFLSSAVEHSVFCKLTTWQIYYVLWLANLPRFFREDNHRKGDIFHEFFVFRNFSTFFSKVFAYL